MRRPMRWYWAAATALLVFCCVGVGVLALAVGIPFGDGILDSVLNALWEILAELVGGEAARVILVLGLASVPFVCGLGIFAFLRRGAPHGDEYLRCIKCGYILKGLSEPRCPECGEPI